MGRGARRAVVSGRDFASTGTWTRPPARSTRRSSAGTEKRRRSVGFWCFVLSNLLWIAWGWQDRAYALVGLQLGLFALNLRGLKKTAPERS